MGQDLVKCVTSDNGLIWIHGSKRATLDILRSEVDPKDISSYN